jgi:hypothetical protein
MTVFLAQLVPPLLALTLIALARDGAFAPRRMVGVAAAAAVLGPLAASVLGFVGWLLMITVGVGALTAFAVWRHSPGVGLLTRE